MRKRTLLYALAVLFTVSGVYGIGEIPSDGPVGAVGCLLVAAILYRWAKKTDPDEQLGRQPVSGDSSSGYTAIDLETTGLSATKDHIIELGAIRVRDGRSVTVYSQLIDPRIPLPADIAGLTGITDSMLQSMPVIESESPKFLEFIGDDMLVGHNVGFDLSFLRNNAAKLGIPFSPAEFRDTMVISQDLYPEMPRHRLVDLIRRLGVADTENHRAADDAMQTAQCYERMRQDTRP